MTYGYKKVVNASFDEAITRVKEALVKEGFGILTEIDVKATLKKKLDVSFPSYTILGACNPTLAHRALEAETEVGLLLPCNVIVYEREGQVFASAMLPSAALGVVDSPILKDIADEAEPKLKSAIDAAAAV